LAKLGCKPVVDAASVKKMMMILLVTEPVYRVFSAAPRDGGRST